MATTLEVSADVEVGGRPLPRGKYSLWLVVDRGEQWTLVLDPDWSRFHTVRPRESTSQVRFAVDVGTAPPTEVLTFDFPEVTSTGTVLRFAWDDRLIRLPIAVRPATSLTMPAAEAAPYVGSWELASAGRESAPSRRFDVSHEKGSLRVHIDPPLWPGGSRLFLIRRGPGVFMLGEEQNGRLADVMSEWSIEFGSGAEEGTFEVRDVAERLIARGSRRSRGSAD